MAYNAEKCEKLRILTITLEGFQNTMEKTLDWSLSFVKDYDVIMLQEIHVGANSNQLFTGILELSLSDTKRNDKLFVKNMHGNTVITGNGYRVHKDIKFYLTHFSSSKRGVGIIINAKHTVSQKFYEDGTYIGLCANIAGKEYTFVSVYFHSNDNKDLLQRCYQDIKKHSQGSVPVIGGSFNVTLTPLDVKEDKEHRLKRRNMFKETWKYSDVWRYKHPEKREFTFKSHWEICPGEKQESRLDYFFMNNDQLNLVDTCEIQNQEVYSELLHKPVSLIIKHTEAYGLDSSKPHDPHPSESSLSQSSHPKPTQKTETKPEAKSNYEHESDIEKVTEEVGGIKITDDSK